MPLTTRPNRFCCRWVMLLFGMLLLGLIQLGNLGCHKDVPAFKVGSAVDTGLQPRLQWQGDGGYCGEASLQTIGLRYGAWISQGLLRKAVGGELLLGVNEEKALKSFGFVYESWDSKGQKCPQFKPFAAWLKGHLLRGRPCMTAIYLAGFTHEDYDHIVPISGLIPASESTDDYDPKDVLIFHNLFSEKVIHRAFQTLPSLRAHCRYGMSTGGNLPVETTFGVAVMGFHDATEKALPVSLAVDSNSEPDWTRKEKPSALKGTVTVSGLKRGESYLLLRYDRFSGAALKGNLSAQLNAKARRTRFKAEGSTWTFADPRPISSSSATCYRCFPAPPEKKK